MSDPIRRAGLGLLLLALGACSTPTVLYQHDRLAPPLEVPPDLTQPQEKGDFAIPQIGRLWAEKMGLGDESRIQVRRDGRLRWLVFQGDPRWLWQRVHDFWIDEGVGLAWEDRKLGILETRWITNPDSRFARDRYRMRVEPGEAEGTVWLFLTHRGVNEVFVDEENEVGRVWGSDFNDPELEVEVMGRFLEFLGVSKGRVQALQEEARRPAPEARREGEALYLPEPPARAWLLIGLALDRLGLRVQAADRQALDYRVSAPGAGLRAQVGQLLGEHAAAPLTLRVEAGPRGGSRVRLGEGWGKAQRRQLLDGILARLG